MGTTYYVRAYAYSGPSAVYGAQVPFTTNDVPTVTTASPSEVTDTAATCGGIVTSDGGLTVSARGVCWSTSQNPIVSDSKTTDGTGTGAFTSNLTGLTANTTYYVRAYATNNVGTAYGNQVSFNSSMTSASVTTQDVSDITASTATGNGTIVNAGSPAATQHGLCWSTSVNPTTADNKTELGAVSSTGTFTSGITGLQAGTTYYVRAYATNSLTTAYGTQTQFTTDTTPTVTTGDISGVTSDAASAGGNVTDDGGDTVTARGVCWNTTGTPTVADNKTTDGTGEGAFISSMTELSADTTYYVRAYATNSVGTVYGNQKTCTTDQAPDDTKPILTIEVETRQQQISVGDDIDCQVQVRNTGTAPAHGVRVTIPLPDNTEFLGAWWANGTPDAPAAGWLPQASQDQLGDPIDADVADGLIYLSIGDVDPSEQFAVVLSLRALASGSYDISASASSDETPEPVVADSAVQTQVDDEYYVVEKTLAPMMCGPFGLTVLVGLLAGCLVIANTRDE